MNTHSGGPWRFRWGRGSILKSLGRSLPGASMIPGRLFRRAPIVGPVLAWLAGMAVHDLRQPDSRIRALARRLLEKRKEPQRVRAEVVGPAVIEGPQGQGEKTGKEMKGSEEE